jgi:hypothetical protein
MTSRINITEHELKVAATLFLKILYYRKEYPKEYNETITIYRKKENFGGFFAFKNY